MHPMHVTQQCKIFLNENFQPLMVVLPTGWKGAVVYILAGHQDYLILTEGVAPPGWYTLTN